MIASAQGLLQSQKEAAARALEESVSEARANAASLYASQLQSQKESASTAAIVAQAAALVSVLADKEASLSEVTLAAVVVAAKLIDVGADAFASVEMLRLENAHLVNEIMELEDVDEQLSHKEFEVEALQAELKIASDATDRADCLQVELKVENTRLQDTKALLCNERERCRVAEERANESVCGKLKRKLSLFFCDTSEPLEPCLMIVPVGTPVKDECLIGSDVWLRDRALDRDSKPTKISKRFSF
jgi:hypothetical protein